MSTLLNSVRWAGIAQINRVAGQLLSMAILSRLLPPVDYGLMAMAGVVTAFAAVLRDLGTGAVIVQRKELTPELTNTVFWLNVGMGVSIGIVLSLGSGVVAYFFHEPKLQGVVLALAGLFPLQSVTIVHQSLIERRSGFKSLAGLDVLNQVSSLAVTILAAYMGAGVYSLVIPGWISAIISTVWLARASGWRPERRWSTAEFKGLWAFSGNLTAFNFVNYFARNADSAVIGRTLGATPLGAYSMGYKLMLFPVQNLTWVVARVMMPRLSQLQDDIAASRALYFKMLSAIVTLSTPLMVGLWALRVPFVATAFGSRWGEVAELLTWLAPIGYIQSMTSTVGSVLASGGRTDLLFRMGLASTIGFVVSFAVGARFGIVGVAIAYLIANVANFAALAWLIGRRLDAHLADLWAGVKAPLLASVAMALAIQGALMATGALRPLFQVAIASCLGLPVYVVVLTKVLGQSLQPLINLVRGRG